MLDVTSYQDIDDVWKKTKFPIEMLSMSLQKPGWFATILYNGVSNVFSTKTINPVIHLYRFTTFRILNLQKQKGFS